MGTKGQISKSISRMARLAKACAAPGDKLVRDHLKSISRMGRLAKACAAPGDELVRVHLILVSGRPWVPGTVRRAGGPPIGVDERTRPRYDGAFMQHLLTVDLREVPELSASGPLASARAVAVFISDAADNLAWEPHTPETAVVALTEEDLALGEWRGPEVSDPAPRAFDLFPVDVPVTAFYDHSAPGFDEDTVDPALVDLHNELMSANRIGGPVIYWSGDTYTKDFLLQFREEVVDVNLSDAGMLYVFADTAFSAGH